MIVSPFPKRIEIELSASCNLACTYCPRHYVGGLNGFMDLTLFKRLIDEAAKHPETILVLHRRGESLLHPEFKRMMAYIRGKFNTVQLATNGTLLNKDNANAIIGAVTFLSFSIDTPRMFNQTRVPANYDSVKANILQFLEINAIKGYPVQTQVSMVKTDKTTPEAVRAFEQEWIGRVNRVRVYERHSEDGNFGSLKAKRTQRKPCTMPFYEMLIFYDGKIGRCNHDWNGTPLDSIVDVRIEDMWHSDRYNQFRNEHETMKIKDPVCISCDSWYPEQGVQGTGRVLEK